ncbi:response regulator [Paracoccus sp. WLY502]|uniref:response regulator n=1 Tax=Paracoccus yibinensis TaxID=3068891 RepID=UPI002796D149|nr:response regulator [Paracoccus sp. WLY502]MDQ1902101.1 response regulator [Paracoccus sp. WLY502]
MIDGTSILILEDEPLVAFALEDMLLDLGSRDVRLATTIAEAMRLLDKYTPDFAVLDVNIRGERSYGVAAELSRREVPFVFATGYGDAEHPETLKAVPTVTKPYSPEDLKSALAAAAGLV